MKFIKFLVPFLAVIIPVSHKVSSNPVSEERSNLKSPTDTTIENVNNEEQLVLRRFEDSSRFLRFAKHSSHSSHKSHSSHSSHQSGGHSSHSSGYSYGGCLGCEFDVEDEQFNSTPSESVCLR